MPIGSNLLLPSFPWTEGQTKADLFCFWKVVIKYAIDPDRQASHTLLQNEHLPVPLKVELYVGKKMVLRKNYEILGCILMTTGPRVNRVSWGSCYM